MLQKSISIDNLEIGYYTNLISSNKTILFIHGNSLDSQIFEGQFDDYLLGEYNLIAIDLPGHGNSSKANNQADIYNLIGYANILAKFIHILELSQVVLVGHSLGGHIAIETTPNVSQVIGLCVFGTPPISIPPAMDEMFLPNPAMAYVFKGELTLEEGDLLAKSFTLGSNKMARKILNTDPDCRSYFGASVGEGKYKNELDICNNLQIPLAILHGKGDVLVNPIYLKNLLIPTLWRNGIQFINAAGHSPQYEQPGEFNRLLSEFITSL